MCMGGAFLYGLSNVAEEYVVKTIDCVEYLAMIGLFGSVINGVQLYDNIFFLVNKLVCHLQSEMKATHFQSSALVFASGFWENSILSFYTLGTLVQSFLLDGTRRVMAEGGENSPLSPSTTLLSLRTHSNRINKLWHLYFFFFLSFLF